MRLKITLASGILFIAFCFLVSCGGKENANSTTPEQSDTGSENVSAQAEDHGDEIKKEDVILTTPLDATSVTEGKSIYDLKCQSCHKLNGERVVGPGWAGVTSRREPHWIMNMITNVDMMLESDPEAQKLLEQCLVRMPNQNLNNIEARQVLEFMRHNDGVK